MDEQMSFPHFPGLRSWEIYSGDQASCPHMLGTAVSAHTANEDTSVKRKSEKGNNKRPGPTGEVMDLDKNVHMAQV